MNEEIRQALMQLLNVCKIYQTKALVQDSVLAIMLEMSPADRSSWNVEKVRTAMI